jgi:hypothetical protein
VLAAAAASAAVLLAPGSAGAKSATVQLSIPSAGDVTVARITGKVEDSSKLPKLKVAKGSLAASVVAIGGVEKKGAGYAADVVVFNTSAAARIFGFATPSVAKLKLEVVPPAGKKVTAKSKSGANAIAKKAPAGACDSTPPKKVTTLAGKPEGSLGNLLLVGQGACRVQVPFTATAATPSWQHNVPEKGKTTICWDVSVDPPIPGEFKGLFVTPSAKSGGDAIDINEGTGKGRLLWVIDKADTYRVSGLVITGIFRGIYTVELKGEVTVPPPPTEGPTPCV